MHRRTCSQCSGSSSGLFQCPCKHLFDNFESLEAHYYERHCGTPGRPKNKKSLTEAEQGTSSIQQNSVNTSDSAVTMTWNDDNNYLMQDPPWSTYPVYNYVTEQSFNYVTEQSLLPSQPLDTQICLPEYPTGGYSETCPNYTPFYTFSWNDQQSNVGPRETNFLPGHADVPATSIADTDATPPQQAATDDQVYWTPYCL